MKRSKYNAKKRKKDGLTFDSTAEMRRWTQLKKKEEAGEISNLRTQVEFVLIPSQQVRFGDVLISERRCSYIADFVYSDGGLTVVEDVKGYKKGAAYSCFVIKRKLMLEKYGIAVREVRM